jgi:tetratricopeptide (TPR) repeat protein
MQTNVYGKELQTEVNKEVKERQDTIDLLQKLLEKNPKARDVLYDLAVLYKENYETDKANEYLKRAQEVDPSIPDF